MDAHRNDDDDTRTRGLHTVETIGGAPPSVLLQVMKAPVLAGRFELSSCLGRGGMGAVYRARDTMLEEDLALKVLDGPVDERQLTRLRQEVKLARRVTHPNVVRTFDMGMHENTPFITMELVESEPLSSVLRREGPLPLSRFFPLARAVCAGLAAAHAASVLHLDLKPANVLIGVDGRIAVTDFGVACLAGTDARAIAGTPSFMAPEQLAGSTVDARADVYALGVLFFVSLTGVLPSRSAPSSSAGVPQEVAFLVLRCLADEPDLRYASAADVLAELLRIAPAAESNRQLTVPPRAPHHLSRSPIEGSPARRAISDATAFERYTLGLLAYQKLWPEQAREAVAHFEVAIQRCPDNATLIAACAMGHIRLQAVSGEPGMERARRLATLASELEPDLANAHLARAAVDIAAGEEACAMDPLRAALARAPWLAEAHARLGEILAEIGEVGRALGELQMAYDFEPLSEDSVFRRAQLHALLGDIEACDILFGARPATDENLSMYAWRRARTLLYAPTAERIARLREDLAPLDFQLKYLVDAVIGMVETRQLPAVVEAVLQQMTTPTESPRRTWFYTLPFVDALAFLGRTDEALTQLEHADRHRLLDLTWLDRTPTLASVRSSPRFGTVRARVLERASRVRAAAYGVGLL